MGEKIAVIGAGAWGTAIANILADNGGEVYLWVRTKRLADILKHGYENTDYLQGIKLNKNLHFYTDIPETVNNASVIFFAVPSQYLRETARKFSPYIRKGSIVVNLAKGIERISCKRMSEILNEELNGNIIAVLSGPNHSIEIAKKKPSATVIACNYTECLAYIKGILSTSYFKVYSHQDIVGVEICGAVKNIPAIATGIISELNYGDNAIAGLITLGLSEMNTLGRHFGSKRSTVYGLAGVGDLVVTCTGRHSRNQFVGRALAQGKILGEITELLHGMVAEGVETTMAIYELSQKHNLKMPLTSEIYNILYNKKDINTAIKDLLKRI